MAVNIDKETLEIVKSSTCYGIAYDGGVPECKKCDVRHQCKAKCEGSDVPLPVKRDKKNTESASSLTPETKAPKSTTKKTATKPAQATKAETNSNPNCPDFKEMTLDDLKALADELKIEWSEYSNDNITRMRLVMALKKHYK